MNKILVRMGLKTIDSYILKKKVVFNSAEELYNWGMKSGWFTQYFCDLNQDIIQVVSETPGIFPLEHEFQAIITLAQKI